MEKSSSNLSKISSEQSGTKLSAAERAEERKKKIVWDEAIFEATLQHGNLIITWKPLHIIHPILYEFEKLHHQQLRSLRLIGVELMELPEDFGIQLRQLEILSLENNKLQSLPDSLAEMINLTECNLSFNKLQYLPERIGFLYNMRCMCLNNNQLVQLPMTFGALTALEKIDLECNFICVLPENLDHLRACHTVNVNRNQLIRLARCFSRMPSLTSLSACWNQLSYIPQELYASKTIIHLRLGMNGISRLSEKLGEMPQLQELILDYNHIVKLPLSTWKLKKLKNFRIEGNEELLDPPTEVVVKGAKAVIDYFTEIFHSDKQARMRHIILTTQNILQQVADRKLYDPSLFEPDVKVEETSEDYWYGLQFHYFWYDLLPKLNHVWKYLQSKGIVIPDIITEFEFNEKEVLWAFTNFSDAYGPVLLHQKAMFRQCSCKDSHGQPMPCIPPRQGYMCSRTCYLIKKHIIRLKDKEDRVWQAYKTQSLIDAERRAEFEANNYLQSSAGKRWIDDSAYEQAEEMMLETGAAKVVEKRIAQAEKKKQKVIKQFNKKISKILKIRDEKVKAIQEELTKLKETRKLAREGYLRDGIEFKINDLTMKLSQMPESIELDNLNKQCEAECEKIDEALYASSSSDNDEDIHHTSDEDSNAYSDDDSSDEAKRWRRRRERRFKKEKREKLLQLMKEKYGKDEEKSSDVLHKIGNTLDRYVIKSVIQPVGRRIHGAVKNTHYRTSKALRNIKEISRIRVRKLLLKIVGTFDEVQRELRYEISRQYVEHQVNLAREKARKEFHVIEQMRQKFQGVSKEKAFIAWKKWVWTKQKRIARDLRRQFKTALRWYNSAMESVRSAQIQVDMWLHETDIYSDTSFWRHAKTGAITFDQPNVYFYLPPNFKIPDKPDDLPDGIDINEKTSSSEESLTEWQRKYGSRRRNFVQAAFSQKRTNIIEEDYHDEIVNPDVLQLTEDQQLEEMVDDNSSNDSLQRFQPHRMNQSIRKTMRQTSTSLPMLLNRQHQQNPQGDVINIPSTDKNALLLKPPSSPSNRTAKSRNILTFTQLNSPFDPTRGEDALQETLNKVILPAIEPSPRPDNIAEAAIQIRNKASDEFEIAYKAIRKKRNQLNPARHSTYMNYVTRKQRSFEQIKGDDRLDDSASTMIEIESGIFINTKGVKDLINPTDEELFKLAGGSLDMKNLGKKGVELRTILARRALHIKQKLYEQAVKKELVQPKRYNFYRREIRPLFVDVYHDSDSEEEEEVERRKKEAKAVIRAKRREERLERRKMGGKIDEEIQSMKSRSSMSPFSSEK